MPEIFPPDGLSDALEAATRSKRQEIVVLLEAAGAKPRVEFKIDETQLARYAGTYLGPGNTELVLTVAAGRLTGSAAPGQRLTFVARDATTFGVAEAAGVTLTFRLDGDKVASVGFPSNATTWTQSGRQIDDAKSVTDRSVVCRVRVDVRAELAVVPGPGGVRRRRRSAHADDLERGDRPERAVEDADRRRSRSRAPSCGAIACSSRPPSAAILRPASGPASTATSSRRRCVEAFLAAHCARQAHRQGRSGTASRTKARRRRSGIRNRARRRRRRSPTAQRVIVSFGSEGLYAYDFDGKLLWKRDLGVLNAGWFYDPDYEWGFGSSPIIWKNLVIVQCDIQKNSFIAAFDVATGQPVWRTDREEIPSWSTPAIFEANGRAELVTQATKFTRGYDPNTGKELWRLSGNSEIAIPTPIIGPNLVIVSNGYTPVQPIFAIKPGATGDITLKAGQTQNEFIAWSTNRGGPYIPTPVIYKDQLYVLRYQRRADGL